MFRLPNFCFYCFLSLPILLSANKILNPIVTTGDGQLRGTSNISRDGRDYYSFLGIPYAELTRRFQVASYPQPWKGIRNATTFGHSCLSYSDYKDIYFGDEDCLYANVYTPKIPDGGSPYLFPVIVYIHEGGFLYHSGNIYNVKYLMDEDVVFVAFNYRLGAFGFLSTEDEEAPGNIGLKDQVKVLEWVQRNIKYFNGDPDKVTIMGYSAGGASVQYHLLSSMSRGLFHRAVALGGSALNPWAFAPKPLENTKILARELGCLFNDTKKIVSCLQNKDAKEIVKLQKKPFVKWFLDPYFVFVPSVEKKIGDGSQNFLTKTPRQIINSKNMSANIPLMTGCVKEDGLLIHGAYVARNESLSQSMDLNWNYVAPITFFYEEIQEANSSVGEDISRKIRNYYFNSNDSIGWYTKYKLAHVYTDRWFMKGIKDFAVSYAENNPHISVFNFIVTYNRLPGLEEYPSFNTTEKIGITHHDDLQLIFKWRTNIVPGSEHYNLSKTYIKFFINFANFGDPNGYQQTGTKWTPLDPYEQRLKWFLIDETFQLTPTNLAERSDFWNSLPVAQ